MDEVSTPFLVLTVSFVLIILAVGTFAFYVTITQTENIEVLDTEKTETFKVSDPSQDLTVTLSVEADSIQLVQEYNSVDWITIPEAGYTFHEGANTLTIDKNYLEG